MTGFYMKCNTDPKWVKVNDIEQCKFSLNEDHQAIIVIFLKLNITIKIRS